jgi:hypothetical protein
MESSLKGALDRHPSMRFEERVTVLCAQALGTDDDVEVGKILAELRLVLHQRIEQLRNGLLVAYAGPMIRPESLQSARQQPRIMPPIVAPMSPGAAEATPRTWQQVVHEISCEKDLGRAVQLSQELSGLLQRQAESPGQS